MLKKPLGVKGLIAILNAPQFFYVVKGSDSSVAIYEVTWVYAPHARVCDVINLSHL